MLHTQHAKQRAKSKKKELRMRKQNRQTGKVTRQRTKISFLRFKLQAKKERRMRKYFTQNPLKATKRQRKIIS